MNLCEIVCAKVLQKNLQRVAKTWPVNLREFTIVVRIMRPPRRGFPWILKSSIFLLDLFCALQARSWKRGP